MSSPRAGYHNSTSSNSSASSSHCSQYNTSAYATPTTTNAAVAVFGNTMSSPGFLNGMSNLMNSAFSSVGQFGLAVPK